MKLRSGDTKAARDGGRPLKLQITMAPNCLTYGGRNTGEKLLGLVQYWMLMEIAIFPSLLEGQSSLFAIQSTFPPSTYGHELRVMTVRMRLWKEIGQNEFTPEGGWTEAPLGTK